MKISISSSRKRGLTPDLRLVQKYLKNNIEDIEFSYFMADETCLLYTSDAADD